MAKERLGLINGPDWYNTPLEELHFEWSPEEKIELERYCEKIHENIAQDEMTPLERYWATIHGKEKDRLFVITRALHSYASKTLDSNAGAIKPRDIYNYPKLHIKEQLALTAKFGFDWVGPYPVSYTEECWGGQAELGEITHPQMVEGMHPVKTMEDLEGIEVPDPKKDGLYPGYLWAYYEMKKILIEYELYDKIVFYSSVSPDQVSVAWLGLMKMSEFMLATKREPELAKRCVELADEWILRFSRALKETGAHGIWCCYGPGIFQLEGNEWMADHYAKTNKLTTDPDFPGYYGVGLPADLLWLDTLVEKGAMGPGGYSGWAASSEIPYKKLIDGAKQYDLFASTAPPLKLVMQGPISEIEADVKQRCEYAKTHPKAAIGVYSIDYAAPQHHVLAATEACKKFGKF
ncbi:MAG: hypothetical protein JXA42_20125 [Anaerolineales bacterium]|nr:hypothetical protein [Anaerolineales bacterium]